MAANYTGSQVKPFTWATHRTAHSSPPPLTLEGKSLLPTSTRHFHTDSYFYWAALHYSNEGPLVRGRCEAQMALPVKGEGGFFLSHYQQPTASGDKRSKNTPSSPTSAQPDRTFKAIIFMAQILLGGKAEDTNLFQVRIYQSQSSLFEHQCDSKQHM